MTRKHWHLVAAALVAAVAYCLMTRSRASDFPLELVHAPQPGYSVVPEGLALTLPMTEDELGIVP